MLRLRALGVVLVVGALVSAGGAGAVTARGAVASDPAEVGELGPLIPFHKDAIHASLVPNGDSFRLCFWMRPAEYRGTDLVDPTVGALGTLKPAFESLVYGGFRFSRGLFGLDESVTTRIKADLGRENTQCLDLAHPDAFSNTGKLRAEDLTDADFALNAGAFSDAGASRGLNYNLFCAGNSMLADGRIVVAGGHDKAGNNGIRKINLFDPATRTWRARPEPPVKRDFGLDPTGQQFPHADPLNELNTDPPDPSDMRYQRWYPTTVALPDGKLLILSGTDQDSSVGPANAAATKVRIAVPEVYDPQTDRTTALENARKLFAMYPRAYVVQTGPGRDDWKVAVTAEVQPPLPTGDALRAYDPFNYNGKTYLLDVRAALADPNRDVPGERHWQLVDTALYAHDSGAGAALWTLDGSGRARSQTVARFGGDSGTGETVAAVEMIDFQASQPRWRRQQDLLQPATQNNAVALPDGKVVVIGGTLGRGSVNTLRLQLFHPASGQIKPLGEMPVTRHDHSTALLLPDASVIIMGGNRTDLVPGNRDAGVPVAQIYKPPYLFNGARPLIEQAPREIAYGSRFDLRLSRTSPRIESAVMTRIGPVTHNWDWGNRHVKLAVDEATGGEPGARTLSVAAPAQPGLAVPGYYLLFAVSDQGVPSVAKLIHLGVPS